MKRIQRTYVQPAEYGGVIGDEELEKINRRGLTGEARPSSSGPECTDCTDTRKKSEALRLVHMRDGVFVVDPRFPRYNSGTKIPSLSAFPTSKPLKMLPVSVMKVVEYLIGLILIEDRRRSQCRTLHGNTKRGGSKQKNHTGRTTSAERSQSSSSGSTSSSTCWEGGFQAFET